LKKLQKHSLQGNRPLSPERWNEMYGPAFPAEGWVPSPSYLLRRRALFSLIKKLPRGKVLEIGSASGAMLLDLTDMGFTAVGLETSEKAHDVSGRILRKYGDIPVYRSFPWEDKGSFDYVIALEVIEHIEDGLKALADWQGLLREGGKLIVSVPAGRGKWSSSDVWAGHFRRYDRMDLISLLSQTGFEPERILSYGFPFKNIIDVARGMYHRRLINKRGVSEDAVDRGIATAESGINRKLEMKIFPLYHNRISSLFLRFAFWLQSIFYRTDLGNGYIVIADKKTETTVKYGEKALP
jgi:SAM-dependent methyltransferase